MNRQHSALVLVLAITAAFTATQASAQETVKVSVGGEQVTVVRDGNTVQLGSGAVVSVTDNWRQTASRVDINDTSILVDLGATEADGRMQLNLAGDVLFDFDSTAIRPDAAVQLAKVAYLIRNRSTGRVEVVGHTDSVGDDGYNQRLSEARALAVIRWLNAKEGIPSTIMFGRGMGESAPVAYNTMPNGADNPAGRAQNRRVEIQFATSPGATRVQVGDTDVSVEGDTVSVGGTTVRVDDAMAAIGAASAGSTGSTGSVNAGTGEGFVCPAAQTCNRSCWEGDCSMTCSASATCNFTCSGGDCHMICGSGASCRFSCSGGDCRFTCGAGSNCTTSCSGEDCVCEGPGC